MRIMDMMSATISAYTYFYETNIRFMMDVMQAAKFDYKEISAIPSFLFMSFSFILIYFIMHRRSNTFTSTKVRVYREVGFQWTYFYVMRVWFLIVKGFRWLSNNFAEQFEMQPDELEEHWLNPRLAHGTLFTFLLMLSLSPLIILVLNCLHKQSIPNFLMWVDEDPWLRSEIGMSGHYLDRPPNFYLPKREEYAYRSRRSTSVEHANKKVRVMRNCRSMENFICITNAEAEEIVN